VPRLLVHHANLADSRSVGGPRVQNRPVVLCFYLVSIRRLGRSAPAWRRVVLLEA
jgi:hypothetical protein